jgi:hypothetical protein
VKLGVISRRPQRRQQDERRRHRQQRALVTTAGQEALAVGEPGPEDEPQQGQPQHRQDGPRHQTARRERGAHEPRQIGDERQIQIQVERAIVVEEHQRLAQPEQPHGEEKHRHERGGPARNAQPAPARQGEERQQHRHVDGGEEVPERRLGRGRAQIHHRVEKRPDGQKQRRRAHRAADGLHSFDLHGRMEGIPVPTNRERRAPIRANCSPSPRSAGERVGVRVCAFMGEAKTLTLTLSHAADGAGEGKQLRGLERW